jgi:hypothetical protein
MGWQEEQKAVARGVTDGTERHVAMADYLHMVSKFSYARNNTLEEVAKEFDRMTSLGDTAASFAAFVRGMKR